MIKKNSEFSLPLLNVIIKALGLNLEYIIYLAMKRFHARFNINHAIQKKKIQKIKGKSNMEKETGISLEVDKE